MIDPSSSEESDVDASGPGDEPASSAEGRGLGAPGRVGAFGHVVGAYGGFASAGYGHGPVAAALSGGALSSAPQVYQVDYLYFILKLLVLYT